MATHPAKNDASADKPGEGDGSAQIGAAGGERGLFGGSVERLRLQASADHPPVTGGKMAISRGLFSGVAEVAKA